MSDTLMRQWHMLRMIPRQPARISTTQLVQNLADEGFTVTQRTLQRDLINLSTLYPLTCEKESKPFGWAWFAHADVLDIPGMNTHAALAFYLAQRHLEPLLPKTTVNYLQPHFDAATRVLDRVPTRQGIPSWRDKIRVLQRGPDLKVPEFTVGVQESVYEAVLNNRCLQVTYFARSHKDESEYQVHPLGLVLKDGLTYLICHFDDPEDHRMLALHRMKKAIPTGRQAYVPRDFDLDESIDSGEFQFAIEDNIKLKIRVIDPIAFHLHERPLSDDQKIKEESKDWSVVTAQVQDTSELRWWLLGFGDRVEVLGPKKLRKDFKQIAKRMAEAYQ